MCSLKNLNHCPECLLPGEAGEGSGEWLGQVGGGGDEGNCEGQSVPGLLPPS